MQYIHSIHQTHANVFFWLIRYNDNFCRAFGSYRLRDLRHRVTLRTLTHLLSACHGNRVVIQNLVGDVDARRDAHPYGQQSAMKVSPIAQVGKHVLVCAEGLLPDPRNTLAPHLGEADRAAIH